MNFILTIILGLLPSFIWLLFFLKKDAHPEPKSMILKVFFAGALVAPIAAFVGTGFQEILLALHLFPTSTIFILPYFFIGVGVAEEFLKYLVIRFLVLSHHEFDEPVDAMLYMVISGLGFAALENLLILFSQTILNQSLGNALSLILYRFLTAVFLHALCSAFIGYFLALSICDTKHQLKLISIGLVFGAMFHGLFDIAITKIGNSLIERGGEVVISDYQTFVFSSALLLVILIGLAVFVTYGFRQLKKIKSICKI